MNNQKLAGLWIDTEKAIVAKNHDEQSASEFFLCNPVKHEIQHGNSNEHTGNNAEQTNKRKFFKEIAELLVNSEKVLITGPGTIQEELKSHLLSTPEYKDLDITLQTSQQMGDQQVLETVKSHFGN